MEGRVKTRSTGSVPRSLGRQIGVLPVGNPPPRARRQLPRQILSSSGRKFSEDVANDSTAQGDDLDFSQTGYDISEQSRTLSGRSGYNNNSAGSRLTRTSGKLKKISSDDSRHFSKKYSPSPPSSYRSKLSSVNNDGMNGPVSSARSTRSGAVSAAESELEYMGKKPPKTASEKDILEQNQETNVNRIYDINLHASELTHVPDLEKFTNLRVLDLSCNFIEKIENLNKTTDMRELKLYDNRLTEIENLKHLKELCTLQLQYNKLQQIGKGLHSLSKLKTVRLDCNKILRIEASELSSCVQLTSINISYNMIDNLSALNYLPNLEECYAAGNRIKQLDLSRCKKLQDIDVSKNRISDLSGLKGLQNLQNLNISANHISTLKPLGKLKTLQELHTSENKISDLSFLPAFFPRLEILSVSCNKIQTLEEVCYLEKCEDLAELFIHDNPFCAPGAEHCHYMAEIQTIIPQLELLDGAHIKRHSQKGAPLMRPMSASTIISVRQVETQLKAAENEMEAFEKSIMDRFDSLRTACGLDLQETPLSVRSLEQAADTRPCSKSSSRKRIKDALQFAADNFESPS